MKIKKINIKEGIDLNIEGKASSNVLDLRLDINRIGLYTNGIAKILVSKGDSVTPLQPLFYDINNDKIKFVAPYHSKVEDIIFDGRKKIGVSLRIDSNHQKDLVEGVRIEKDRYDYNDLSADNIKKILLDTSLFNYIRKRPFSDIPDPGSIPSSIFINFMDKDPLPTDLSLMILDSDSYTNYKKGLDVISKLSSKTFVCIDEKVLNILSKNNVLEDSEDKSSNIEYVMFSGSYPAGLVGTHIHKLDPISSKDTNKQVWYLDIETVLSIGKLFRTSILDSSRIVSVSGDLSNPTHVKLLVGSDMEVLSDKNIINKDQTKNLILGSLFNGRNYNESITSKDRYLSMYDNKVSVLKNKDQEKLFSWLYPESHKYSFYNVVVSKLFRKSFSFSSLMNGSKRSIFPVEGFDKVFPFDTDTLFLLKSLSIKDTDLAIKLGCMELDEEDMGLCSFIDPAKNDYGVLLRENLDLIKSRL